MSEGKPVNRTDVESAVYVFEERADGEYECVKARKGDVHLGGIYSRMTVRDLAVQHHIVITKRRLAEVLPFVPRPTPESIAQVELVSLLERYVDLARAGEVTGVIIAAKTEDDVLTGEIMAEYIGVNQRERTLLIEELREVSSYDYDV